MTPKNSSEAIYRPCVGVALINRDGLVFIGRRRNKAPVDPAAQKFEWQMPQGGIDAGETPAAAVLRELREETGVTSVSPLAEIADWLRYDLPTDISRKSWRGRFRGQTQKWFALRFEGDDAEVEIHHPPDGLKPEFDDWRWEKMANLPDLVIPFKRPVYEAVVAEFARFSQR